MSELKVYSDQDASTATVNSQEHAEIAAKLANIGVRCEQWQTDEDIGAVGGVAGRGDEQAVVGGRLGAARAEADRAVAAQFGEANAVCELAHAEVLPFPGRREVSPVERSYEAGESTVKLWRARGGGRSTVGGGWAAGGRRPEGRG